MKSTVKMYEIYNVIFSDGEILREATLPEIHARQGERRGVISPVIVARCLKPGKLFAVDYIGAKCARLGTYTGAIPAQIAANQYAAMSCTDFAAMICRKEA